MDGTQSKRKREWNMSHDLMTRIANAITKHGELFEAVNPCTSEERDKMIWDYHFKRIKIMTIESASTAENARAYFFDNSESGQFDMFLQIMGIHDPYEFEPEDLQGLHYELARALLGKIR